ncbi:hypothetical protein MKX01_039784 [Papaver californicum]|nr:hypothetical protein MKX01_039784 [Papaver californicum]
MYSYLTIHRGDFVLPDVSFVSNGRPSPLWPMWLKRILVKPFIRSLIVGLDISDAIDVSLFRHINRSSSDLIRLVLRWLPEVHTFLFAWGEATPTLEDVVARLRLPIHDFHFFEETVSGKALNDDDRKIARYLESDSSSVTQGLVTSYGRHRCDTDRRAGFPAWIQLWLALHTEDRFQDSKLLDELRFVDDRTEFAAFLAYWGVTFPLAPMFLGGLYHHLDVLVGDLRWANAENFTVESFVPTAFLQV